MDIICGNWDAIEDRVGAKEGVWGAKEGAAVHRRDSVQSSEVFLTLNNNRDSLNEI